jgi:ribose transport system substrate-binding protein
MKLRTGLLTGLLVLALAGCGGQSQETGPASEATRPVIGVSLLSTANPFFQEIGQAITAEAARHGYDVRIVSGDLDIGKQQNQVSDFVVQQVAAIVLTPIDSKAIGTSIQEANQAGIPVFTADIAATAEGAQVVAHIATDNAQAGRMAAQALIEALGGRGKIGILDHPEVESVQLRTRGFREELAAQAPAIEIVSILPGSGAKDRSFQAATDMLQAHPDLNGIFAINDPSALGAVAAIEQAGKQDRIKVVAIDGQPEGRQAIRDGKIYADAIQHPGEIGRKTVEAIVRYMNGEAAEPQVLIPTNLYRQADAQADTTLNQP